MPSEREISNFTNTMDYRALFFLLICVFSDCALCNEQGLFADFANSSTDVQKSILAKAFNERISHAKNLFYQNTVELELRKHDNGEEGEEILGVGDSRNRRSYAHWQLNDDYRMKVGICLAGSAEPGQWVDLVWDSREGILKNMFQSRSVEGRTFGRIDTQLDQVVMFNDAFAFWLQGGAIDNRTPANLLEPHPYLFPHLLENENVWVIECLPQEGNVRLSFEYTPKFPLIMYVKNTVGKRTLTLDSSKGFMPVSGMSRWNIEFDNRRDAWKEERFDVEESQMVAHVWMPIRLKTVVRSSAASDRFSIRRINVSEISHGNVTRADVTLQFPKGTEVTDAIDGTAYKTDARGNPIESTTEPLYDIDPSHVEIPQPKGKSPIQYVFLVIGILLILLAFYMMFRKWRKTS